VESALIVEVKAGLVAVHEGEVRLGGRILEGSGEAIEGIGGGLGRGIFEHAGFDGHGSAEMPVVGNHFLYQAELTTGTGALASRPGGMSFGISVNSLGIPRVWRSL
jgi:hypothetical protein